MLEAEITVTGMGCFCAPGNSVSEAMRSMLENNRHPQPTNLFDSPLVDSYPVFEILNPPRHSNNITRTNAFLLEATHEAITQAGLTPEELADRRVGVSIGTTVGVTLNDESWYRSYREQARPDTRSIRRYLANNPSLFLLDYFKLTGPVATVTNACSSGVDAIGLGAQWLRAGLCDLVLSGGADELNRTAFLGFSALNIASKESCRPFDQNRSGLNLGEGAGICVLERHEEAHERSAEVLANLAGYASYCDAFHPTGPNPEGKGLHRAIEAVLKEAGIKATEIDFINAHGTSTPENDKVEGQVIADMFEHNPPVVSTKAFTGHTLGAAGTLEAIFTIQSLIDGELPPTAGFEEPDPDCVIIPTTRRSPVGRSYALSNSLAFGGTNSVILFSRRLR